MKHEPLKILIAEDNEDDVVLIQEALESGARLELTGIVSDGLETLAYLRKEGKFRDAMSPQLLLLDLNMPGKGGLDVLKELKAEPGLRELPVVILTSSHREEDARASYRAGACSFVTKPDGLPAFLALVRQFEIYWLDVAQVPDAAKVH